MVSAATMFRKSGFNDSDAATLAKVAAQYQNVADTAVSAEDAAASIVSQIRAFGEDASFATKVIDAYNEVANKFSVGTNDLSNAMEIASSGMATYGNEFSEIIGLVTAGTEIMTGRSSQVARGLNTIASRIVKNQDTLAEYGIAVENVDGSLKSTFDVLSELKPKWDSMTDAQRVALGDTLAGQNQYKVLASVMQNFQHAIDATNTALNSAGSAAHENERYMESLEAREQAVKAEFEDFANRVLSKDLVSGFLSAGEAALKFVDTDLGAVITRIAGIGTAVSSVVGIVGTMGAKLALVSKQLSATGGATGLLGLLTTPKTVLIIGAVASAIALVAEGINAIQDYKESQKFENLVNKFEELDEKADEAATNLEDAKKRLDELNNTSVKDRGSEWQNEVDKLEMLIEYYEHLSKLREQEAKEAGAKAYSADVQTGVSVTRETEDWDNAATGIAPVITDVVGDYKNIQQAVWDIAKSEGVGYTKEQEAALEGISDESKKAAQAVKYLQTNLESLGYSFTEGTQSAAEYQNSQAAIMNNAAQVIASTKKLSNAQKEEVQALLETNQGRYEYISGLEVLDESQQRFKTSYEHMLQAFEDATPFANVASEAEQAANSLDNYLSALEEYKGATAEAANSSATLVNSLFDANGQLTEAAQQALTTDGAMASMAQSFIQSQMQAAQADYSTLILAIQEVGSAAMMTSAQLANMMAMAGVGGSTSDMKRTYQIKYGKSAEADPEAYNKWLSSTLSDAADAKYRYRMQELQKQLDQVSGYVLSSDGSSGKSAKEKAAEEAEKQAKKAQQAQEKAAKESQKAYESAAKSAEQAAQQAAQAAEQAAEEAKQKILDTISELKDASDEFWSSKTDAVEETNTELDRQKQLEEKLKALEEAKQKKILLYKNGQFQYDKDYGTIAKAQADYEETRDKIRREKELEQLKEMKENATEIFNEMKDIVENGGNVTQNMIDNWLSQIQTDGADYYDSNKQMLSEWLDWAKSAISEISNQANSSSSSSGYSGNITTSSGNDASTGGSIGWKDLASGKSTFVLPVYNPSNNGTEYINMMGDVGESVFGSSGSDTPYGDYMKYLSNLLEFVDKWLEENIEGNLRANLTEIRQDILARMDKLGLNDSPYVYAWKGLFDRELKGILDLDSNTVFAGYQDKLLSGDIDDPYEEQEYYQRNQAIKALYNEYKKVTDQLGYIPDYLKDFMDMGSKMLSNVDLVARQMAEDYDNLSSSGKSLLDSLVSGEEDYEAANKMRIAYLAENYSPERLRYMNLAWAAGSSRNAMQLMNQRTEEDKARDEALYGDWLDELRDKIDKAGGVVTDEIYNWYLKTAGGALGAKGTGDAQLYADVFAGGGKYLYSDQEELERLGYHGFLGNFGNVSEGGLSDVTKNLVKSKILTSTTETNIDKQKEQITQNNIKGIKDTLEKYQEGYGATQHWIDDATKYITDTLNKNNEALLTADAETRKSLLAQNEELMGIRDSLGGVEADEDISKLPGTTTAYNEWEFKIDNPTDEELAARAEQRAQKLAEQMAANSAAWWDASSKAEQDALHKANEELAKEINKLTGSNLTYEGSSGTWSKNASGTHNFRGGLSLVGERGPELRVLGQGDSIIPAYQTANLWKWSSTTPDSMLKTLELRKGDGRNSYVFNVSKLELPNVSNAKEFVAGLKNYALQYSYKR